MHRLGIPYASLEIGDRANFSFIPKLRASLSLNTTTNSVTFKTFSSNFNDPCFSTVSAAALLGFLGGLLFALLTVAC
jgi:hypothetical protein